MNIAWSLRSLWGDKGMADPRAWMPFAGGTKTASGADIGPDSALKISAYFAMLRNIGEDTAGLPLGIFQKTDKGREKRQEHPAFKLLNNRADVGVGAFNFRASWTMAAPGWGGAYAYIVRAPGGEPLALKGINPAFVVGTRIVEDERWYHFQAPGMSEPVSYPERDILHLYGVGPTGYGGYSLAGLAAETLGLSAQAEKFGANFYANGAIPSVALKFPPKWEPGQPRVDRALEEWKRMAGGTNALDSRGVRPLFDGMDIQTFAIHPNDSQFLETRQFQIEEIARWGRMPPHMIQHLLRSSFNNIEQQGLEYVNYCLWAWLRRIQDEVWAKLLTEREQDAGYYMEHNVAALLRGDMAAQANYFRTMQNQGNLTINDVKELNNQNGIGPLGDITMVPVFVQPIEAAIKKAEAEAAKVAMLVDQSDARPPQVPPSQGGDNTRDNPRPGAVLAPVIEAALRESATRAMKATAAAGKKYQDDPGGFNLWRRDFFAGHADYTALKLLPAAKALAAMTGREASPIMNLMTAYAQERAENQSGTASAPGAPETWADRVQEEAAEILHLIGVDHAASH